MGRTRRALASPARIKRPTFYDVASVRPPDRCEYSCSYYALPRGVFRRSTSSYRARRSDDATFKGLFLFYEPWFKKKIASHVGAGVGGSCDPPFRKKGADERRSAHASAPSAAARRRRETAVAVASGRTKNESPPEEPEPSPSFAAAAAAADGGFRGVVRVVRFLGDPISTRRLGTRRRLGFGFGFRTLRRRRSGRFRVVARPSLVVAARRRAPSDETSAVSPDAFRPLGAPGRRVRVARRGLAAAAAPPLREKGLPRRRRRRRPPRRRKRKRPSSSSSSSSDAPAPFRDERKRILRRLPRRRRQVPRAPRQALGDSVHREHLLERGGTLENRRGERSSIFSNRRGHRRRRYSRPGGGGAGGAPRGERFARRPRRVFERRRLRRRERRRRRLERRPRRVAEAREVVEKSGEAPAGFADAATGSPEGTEGVGGDGRDGRVRGAESGDVPLVDATPRALDGGAPRVFLPTFARARGRGVGRDGRDGRGVGRSDLPVLPVVRFVGEMRATLRERRGVAPSLAAVARLSSPGGPPGRVAEREPLDRAEEKLFGGDSSAPSSVAAGSGGSDAARGTTTRAPPPRDSDRRRARRSAAALTTSAGKKSGGARAKRRPAPKPPPKERAASRSRRYSRYAATSSASSASASASSREYSFSYSSSRPRPRPNDARGYWYLGRFVAADRSGRVR